MLVSQGGPVAEAIRTIGVTPFTYCRWRKEFGGLKTDPVKRLKELEKDRAIGAPLVQETMARERLLKAVSDLTLEKLILGLSACAPSVRAHARTPWKTFEPRPSAPLHRPRQGET